MNTLGLIKRSSLLFVYVLLPLFSSGQSSSGGGKTAPSIPASQVMECSSGDILKGEYRVWLMENKHEWNCAYPAVELLPDDTIITTTYGHWTKGTEPYIVSVRLTMDELDQRA